MLIQQLFSILSSIKQKTLNVWLREKQTFFPIDPGSNPTLGGMTVNGSSGTTAVGYGTMRENVKSIRVVTADGTIMRTGTRAKKVCVLCVYVYVCACMVCKCVAVGCVSEWVCVVLWVCGCVAVGCVHLRNTVCEYLRFSSSFFIFVVLIIYYLLFSFALLRVRLGTI